VAVIMSQICWTNVTTGIQRISGATSRPLGCFIQAGARHKLVVSKKTIGSEGYCEKTIRIGPQGVLPSLSSLLCVVKRKSDSSRKRGSQTGLPAARIAVTLRPAGPRGKPQGIGARFCRRRNPPPTPPMARPAPGDPSDMAMGLEASHIKYECD
jgi:hypothetical protein